MTYLVTAYRWGCTNGHAYHVYGGVDRTKALALARLETEDRGGKYGCVVWEFDPDGTDYKSIAYYGSSFCDNDAMIPRHNHRIDYFERLGQFVHEAASGKVLQPDPTDEKRMTYQECEALPDFLRKEIDRQKGFLAIWQKTDTKQPTNA